LNYAVCANDEKEIVFYEADFNTLSTINKDWLTLETSRFYKTNFTEIICKTITLDKLVGKYQPDLIKIDVEGGEFQCLQSLSQKVPMVCFEWASEMNEMTFQCLDHLFRLGFTQFQIQDGDEYTYRPESYTTIETVKQQLSQTIPKLHCGMIWAI
jgi:hypothetical protein